MTPEVAGTIWKETIKAAEENNHPGKFTAFCSYEWTSMPSNRNMHRNIFFRDCKNVPPMPYSALDSHHPEDLWNWMDTQRKAGNELLAISHNANVSDGWMYPVDLDSFGTAHRCGLGSLTRPQRTPCRNQADQGAIRDPSLVVAQRRVRQL